MLAGKATVSMKGQNMVQVGPPQLIGEVGFICKEARIATVIADEDVKVTRLDATNFARLPAKVREAIKDKIIAGPVSLLLRVNETLLALKMKKVPSLSLNSAMLNLT